MKDSFDKSLLIEKISKSPLHFKFFLKIWIEFVQPQYFMLYYCRIQLIYHSIALLLIMYFLFVLNIFLRIQCYVVFYLSRQLNFNLMIIMLYLFFCLEIPFPFLDVETLFFILYLYAFNLNYSKFFQEIGVVGLYGCRVVLGR